MGRGADGEGPVHLQYGVLHEPGSYVVRRDAVDFGLGNKVGCAGKGITRFDEAHVGKKGAKSISQAVFKEGPKTFDAVGGVVYQEGVFCLGGIDDHEELGAYGFCDHGGGRLDALVA